MKVVFDGACFDGAPITGVGRAFLHGLGAYLPNADGPVVLLLPRGVAVAELEPLAARGLAIEPAPRGALRRQLALPRLLRALQASVLHSSVTSIPLRAPCPTIATAHDFPWLAPRCCEPAGLRRRAAARFAVRRADAVLAPSLETLAHARQLGGPRVTKRLHLVPHGSPLPPLAPPPEARHGPFLVLGDDRPRKNRLAVQAAHAQARRACPDLPALQFVGPPGAFVDEAGKAELLRSCRALVHCSLIEGFGMPVLEAMGHGAPVVCSDIPALRELAADAAILVDPGRTAAIADALVRCHADPHLRAELVRRGRQRAALFQPERVAQAWLALHRSLCR